MSNDTQEQPLMTAEGVMDHVQTSERQYARGYEHSVATSCASSIAPPHATEEPNERTSLLQATPDASVYEATKPFTDPEPTAEPEVNDIQLDVPEPSSTPTKRLVTLAERIEPVRSAAIREKKNFTRSAAASSFFVSVASALQVTISALTAGLPAFIPSEGKMLAIATSTVGGLTTIITAYLSHTRALRQPARDLEAKAKLESLVREIDGFLLDNANVEVPDARIEKRLYNLRMRFETIMDSMRLEEPAGGAKDEESAKD